jgi:hypothetical protein
MTETSELLFLTEGGGEAGDQTFDAVHVTLSGAAAQAGPSTDLGQTGTGASLDALGAAPAEGVYFTSDYESDSGEGEISNVYEEHFGSALTYTDPLNSIDQTGVYGNGAQGNPIYLQSERADAERRGRRAHLQCHRNFGAI